MIQMKAKVFFSDKAILSFMDKKTARAMSRALSHIWQRARTSMRYRKAPSAPGQPPSAHKETGAFLRALMRFAFDPRAKRGVVGPLRHGRGVVPALQEAGGLVTNRRARNTRLPNKDFARIPVGAQLRYEPRPYMKPALDVEIPKLPQQWASSVNV